MATYFTTVPTPAGEVTVLTKTRYLFLLNLPRTSVMPVRAANLRDGVQFRWATSDPAELERLHDLVIQTFREGVSLSDWRGIADIGRKLMAMGLPFIPPDAPLPECVKQVSLHVKRVI